jgi:hypothetical protein
VKSELTLRGTAFLRIRPGSDYEKSGKNDVRKQQNQNKQSEILRNPKRIEICQGGLREHLPGQTDLLKILSLQVTLHHQKIDQRTELPLKSAASCNEIRSITQAGN